MIRESARRPRRPTRNRKVFPVAKASALSGAAVRVKARIAAGFLRRPHRNPGRERRQVRTREADLLGDLAGDEVRDVDQNPGKRPLGPGVVRAKRSSPNCPQLGLDDPAVIAHERQFASGQVDLRDLIGNEGVWAAPDKVGDRIGDSGIASCGRHEPRRSPRLVDQEHVRAPIEAAEDAKEVRVRATARAQMLQALVGRPAPPDLQPVDGSADASDLGRVGVDGGHAEVPRAARRIARIARPIDACVDHDPTHCAGSQSEPSAPLSHPGCACRSQLSVARRRRWSPTRARIVTGFAVLPLVLLTMRLGFGRGFAFGLRRR
jgi:hypothetical protein